MTQQSITRLKAVEEALALGVGALEVEAANYHEAMKGYRPERHAAMDREVEKANDALSDLRELIKEAEGQESYVYATRRVDDAGVPCYTALGESHDSRP